MLLFSVSIERKKKPISDTGETHGESTRHTIKLLCAGPSPSEGGASAEAAPTPDKLRERGEGGAEPEEPGGRG